MNNPISQDEVTEIVFSVLRDSDLRAIENKFKQIKAILGKDYDRKMVLESIEYLKERCYE